MFKLKAKLDADSLLYMLSHFECDGHTVLMLTQQHLPPPLTSTVKSSLFMHAHSSPPCLAARLHRCHANCSHFINNGWAFSRQTSYCVCVCVYTNVWPPFKARQVHGIHADGKIFMESLGCLVCLYSWVGEPCMLQAACLSACFMALAPQCGTRCGTCPLVCVSSPLPPAVGPYLF